MAMIEVAYQIHDVANILVASERTEPGDGWGTAVLSAVSLTMRETTPHRLVRDIVEAYRDAYRDDMTLSAIDLAKIPLLARHVSSWAGVADPANFHHRASRRPGLQPSPWGWLL